MTAFCISNDRLQHVQRVKTRMITLDSISPCIAKKSSASGNWTRVICVTGRYTNHYTNADLFCSVSCNVWWAYSVANRSFQCFDNGSRGDRLFGDLRELVPGILLWTTFFISMLIFDRTFFVIRNWTIFRYTAKNVPKGPGSISERVWHLTSW